jgi:hypothetical protein
MAQLPEAPINMARRHIREGAERCARQCTLIARMKAGEHDTAEAEHLLAQLEHFLALSRAHLARLLREAKEQS